MRAKAVLESFRLKGSTEKTTERKSNGAKLLSKPDQNLKVKCLLAGSNCHSPMPMRGSWEKNSFFAEPSACVGIWLHIASTAAV